MSINRINNKFILMFFLILIINLTYSQNNNSLNIVNSSSVYINNMEYNTGEIFVVYNFTLNQTITKNNIQSNSNEEVTQIVLYPNPTKDALYYNLPSNILFENVELYDQSQKVIFSSNENNKQISLSSFPSGTYFVMFNKNKLYNFKIIKQ